MVRKERPLQRTLKDKGKRERLKTEVENTRTRKVLGLCEIERRIIRKLNRKQKIM